MSLRLLIDEDTLAKPLVKSLQIEHDIATVNDVGLSGSSDEIVLDYAITNNRILITHNCNDFKILHETGRNHWGILAIYRDRDRTKDMTRKEIVRAIANLEAAQVPLANQFIVLNHWNY